MVVAPPITPSMGSEKGCVAAHAPVPLPRSNKMEPAAASPVLPPPHPEMELTASAPSPPSPPSTYTTVECLSSTLAKALPLRVELMEGYMSNSIPHITFSASDMFNIHLLKQQEVGVVRVGWE